MQDLAIEIITAVGIIAAAVILSWVVGRVLSGLLARHAQRSRSSLDDVIVRAAILPARMAILVFALELALNQLSFIPEAWGEVLSQIFFVAYMLFLFSFLYQLIGGVADWYTGEVAHRTETALDDKFLNLFRSLAVLALIAVVVIMILGRFNIEVNGLIASLGIASLAVALAAQDTLGNIFAGFSIMVDRPFAVGDRVEILDINAWGDVQEIGLRSTRILTRDNRTVSVPNSVIGQGLVVNYSRPETKYRVETTVGIAYDSDLETARQVMIDAVRRQDWVMAEERIEALFLEFGEYSLNFTVRCWIRDYVETRRIIDKLNTVLYLALREAGITIPYPQRDLRLVSKVRLEEYPTSTDHKLDGR